MFFALAKVCLRIKDACSPRGLGGVRACNGGFRVKVARSPRGFCVLRACNGDFRVKVARSPRGFCVFRACNGVSSHERCVFSA